MNYDTVCENGHRVGSRHEIYHAVGGSVACPVCGADAKVEDRTGEWEKRYKKPVLNKKGAKK